MSFLDETKKKAEEAANKASGEVKEAVSGLKSYCSNCGKELDAESNFCSKCGARTENGVKAGGHPLGFGSTLEAGDGCCAAEGVEGY